MAVFIYLSRVRLCVFSFNFNVILYIFFFLWIFNFIIYIFSTPFSLIEEATCTDGKQQWGKLKTAVENMYAIQPVSKFCHMQKTDHTTLIRYEPSQNINLLNTLTEGKHELDLLNYNVLE